MERDNSWGGAAIHELASPLYKESNKEVHGYTDLLFLLASNLCFLLTCLEKNRGVRLLGQVR